MLDLYAAGVVNVSVAGLPDTMALVAPEPDIYPRLSQQQCCMGVKQTVALRWGLQLKTGQLYWDDWYFATAFQDFTGDTSFLGYGGFGTPYHHGWNARDPRITKADLGWSTSAWYGRAGVPAGNGYRLRLQVAWYDRDGRAQANNQYAVPINGYGTDWDRWAYWNGVNGAGIGQWFVGR